jgi:filamentous hemagglutinin family protein
MRYLLLSSSLTTCALLMGMGGVAVANPEGGVVVAGAATISESVARLDVTQTTDRAVIDWRSFNIEVGETTAFHQPNSGSVTVNRVKTNDPSRIAGNLTANGNIVLINPAGVFFSKDAVVDVGGLIATSSDIDTGRAMAGDFRFDRAGFSDAQITNEGTITARESGLVGLVAPQVENHGVITAKLGKVHLASGDQMTVDLYGDGVINIGASDELTHQLVHNTGKIEATGGEIRMTAAAGAQVVNSLISVEGELKAPAVTQTGGKIIIGEGNHSHISIAGSVDVRGRSGGQVQISGHNIIQQGTISAEGREGTGGEVRVRFSGAYLDNESSHIRASGQSGKGGTIAVTGETGSQAFISGTYDVSSMMDMGGRVQVTTDEGHLKLFGSRVMARGATGGGSIAIGGEYRGGGTLAHALTTGINYATYLDASALDGGDGGDIVVWSDENTSFAGHADARGGSLSGNGGLIEVSSKQLLRMDKNSQITAAARSLSGLAGTLLLDPKDIIIATGGLDGGISAFELVDPNVDTGIFGGGWIRTLSTGNVLVTDSLDDLMATNSGAVYLFNAATGALISTLFGTTANDQVGNDFITLLSNGNYVVRSLGWDNGAFADAGAATWGNGLTGVVGAVSAANSLVGTRANDSLVVSR